MVTSIKESTVFAAVMTAVVVAYILLLRQSLHTWSVDSVTKAVSVSSTLLDLSLRETSPPITVLQIGTATNGVTNRYVT